MSCSDTIAAISTALSNSGISIIRVSGEDAISKIDNIYKGKKNLTDVDSHTINYGHIYDNDKLIDEVLVSVFKAPNTFTRENVVEINCHGGIYVTKKILEIVISNGVRLAEPGEFTKRAFLNGRIDLSRAESVMDIISSNNKYALDASVRQLEGSVYNEVKLLRDKIIYEVAYIESALDDPEHYSLDDYSDRLNEVVGDLQLRINTLIKDSDNGMLLKNGINTAIVGKPNVGKSSLLNVLAKKEKSIVTDIPGTTRDIIEEQINLHGIVLNIIDTAGIRDSENVVEKIGVDKSFTAIDEADFIIYVVDSSIPLDDNDLKIIEKLHDKKYICLLNKSDLASNVDEDKLNSLIDSQVISISAKEGQGIDRLEDTIKNLFFDGDIDVNNEVIITSLRHKELLCKCVDSLKLVEKSLNDNMPEDFYSIDLMDAYRYLGLIIGEEVEDDLVEEIFSKFCMGK
ncbi:MAG: tRNA uridine-5-carboxymethylaminomethyl(34) synthesis GTPase MnmE [Lachnospiraceae bacterium]|nr:tRNA uridine-5-carboxymethylaminomethyl(34) synthesis GTPase MnmE [Lachnospiraceae bacterium]